MRAIAVHGQFRRIDRLDGAHRIALDTRYLHEPADGVAGQAEVVFHADLGSFLDVIVAAPERRRKTACRHRASDADFALAPHLGA